MASQGALPPGQGQGQGEAPPGGKPEGVMSQKTAAVLPQGPAGLSAGAGV